MKTAFDSIRAGLLEAIDHAAGRLPDTRTHRLGDFEDKVDLDPVVVSDAPNRAEALQTEPPLFKRPSQAKPET